MERIKSFFISLLLALVVFAGFGFGIMALGFAIVLGAIFALTLRLATSGQMGGVENATKTGRARGPKAEPTAA